MTASLTVSATSVSDGDERSPLDAMCVCTHCGQPIPSGTSMARANESTREDPNTPMFCCAGCEAVYATLHACGLEQFYALQRAAGSSGNRPTISGSHTFLDYAEFKAKHVIVLANGCERVEMRLDGLKCGACLWLLEALPRLSHGLLSARVDLGRSVIALEWNPSQTSLSTVAACIGSLGYSVRPIGTVASRAEWRAQDRAWLIDIAVAGAISGNVMAIAFALYGAQLAWMDDATRQFLQWTSVALAGLSVFWPGRMFLRNALHAIHARRPHMDLPIALALLSGLIGGALMSGLGRSGVYLESVSMLVFLLLVGRFVQFRQQRFARHEVELLCALVPATARRVDATGALEEIPSDALRVGDVIEIPAGESVGADGALLSEQAHVDMQLLTGESRPVHVRTGEAVFAGTRLLGSVPIRVRVSTSGAHTRAASIASMVELALSKRPPTVEFANRIAGWFLLCVLIVAMITGVVWWWIEPSRALPIVIALLVVTCPCALGLATPLTIVASLGKAARAGMLIRGGDVLERLSGVGSIVLDKTGTLTQGRMQVVACEGVMRAVDLACVLERHSTHPVARAIVEYAARDARAGATESLTARELVERASRGISGVVDGVVVDVGSVRSMEERGICIDERFDRASRAMVARGHSPTMIALDGRVAAVLGIGDPLREDAAALVRTLRERGWKLSIASGDVDEITQQVGEALGFSRETVRGACTPEDKVTVIDAQVGSPTVMVGDGVNDLPAMAAAHVGIAVRQGAQATVLHADVALTAGGLAQINALLVGARRTMRTIHVNFAISLAYNIVGGVLAVTGVINPLIAAILMPLSGLTVTAVALRMPRFVAPEPTETSP